MNPLTPIDIAVAWAITQIHAGLSTLFGPASGWSWAGAIVILVVLMRLILVPLFIKQLHATRKMTALAPQVKALKQKYKNDKQKLNEETMRLYKENGANPLAGCLPMVAQFPLFFALFDVLRAIAVWKPGHPGPYGMPTAVVATAQHAHIFGATVADRFLTNLFPPKLDAIPHSSQLVIFIFVAISATTTFMTVRQSTKRGMNPQMTPDNPMAGAQKYMAYVAPVFALSGLYWQFGLVLYWVTTNMWTLGQQYFLFKRYPMPKTDDTAAPGSTGPAAGAGAAGKDGSTGRPAAAKQVPAGKAGAGKQVTPAGKQAGVKPAGAKQATGRQPGAGKAAGGGAPRPPAARPGGQKPSVSAGGQKPSVNGNGNGNGSGSGPGVLRRFGRGRPEPEEQPAQPEVKLVRQQRVRQSRSKRSGKR